MTGDLERREHILAVAERLLRHYGPQKTTIAEIARAADVGVGTVYLEFPSKEAIVEELSRVRHRGVLGAMESAGRSADRRFETPQSLLGRRVGLVEQRHAIVAGRDRRELLQHGGQAEGPIACACGEHHAVPICLELGALIQAAREELGARTDEPADEAKAKPSHLRVIK